MEQTRAYRRLMDARGISLRGLAERLHVSPAAISKALATLELPEAIQESVDAVAIKPHVAYHLTQVHDPADQAPLAARVVAECLSRAETVEVVKKAAGRPRSVASKGRGVKPRKVTERAFKIEGRTRVSLENRKRLDGRAIVAALREATAKAEAELGGDQVAAGSPPEPSTETHPNPESSPGRGSGCCMKLTAGIDEPVEVRSFSLATKALGRNPPEPAPGLDWAREGPWAVTSPGTSIPGCVVEQLPDFVGASDPLPLARPIFGRILLANSQE